MSMERWNPFREMETFRQAMDRLFDDRYNGYMTNTSNQSASVAIDMHQTDTGYEVNASLPGVKPEDVDITVNRDVLTIRGRTHQSTERKEGNYIYHERHSGTFQRTIRLPEAINTEQVQANLENGVLKLELPRLQQTPQRRIQVQSSSNTNPTVITSGLNEGSIATSGQSNTQTEASANSSPNTQRPSLLNNLTSTQFDSLEGHVMAKDEAGFKATAQSYGWDEQTTNHVWHYMLHRPTQSEARTVFEEKGQSSQTQVQQ